MPFDPALKGIPPAGIGFYYRSRRNFAGPWTFYIGQGSSGDQQWGFVGVTPMSFADGNDPFVHMDRELNNVLTNNRDGIILDPETPYTPAQIDRLAEWIREASTRTRVGVTSFNMWGGITRLARAVGPLFWGSPQLYYDAVTNARGWRRWQSLLGTRIIPTVAAYIRGPITRPETALQRSTPAGYDEHLDGVPRVGGVLVWPNYPVPDYMPEAVRRKFSGEFSPLLQTESAPQARAQLLTSTSRVGLYEAGVRTDTATVVAQARAQSRTAQIESQTIRLPGINAALGFDFVTGLWTNADVRSVTPAEHAPEDPPGD